MKSFENSSSATNGGTIIIIIIIIRETVTNLNDICWWNSCRGAYKGSKDSSPCDHTSLWQTWGNVSFKIISSTFAFRRICSINSNQHGINSISIVVKTWLALLHTSIWWAGHRRWPARRVWDQICGHWSTEGCQCTSRPPSAPPEVPVAQKIKWAVNVFSLVLVILSCVDWTLAKDWPGLDGWQWRSPCHGRRRQVLQSTHLPTRLWDFSSTTFHLIVAT